MTGLINRRVGLELLERYMKYSSRNNITLTIAFIDINDLKQVNDNLGHKYGDKLIKKVSRIMNDNVRASDVVIRFGGDEFLIIFPDCYIKGANEIFKRIMTTISRENNESHNRFKISLSYGLAEYNGSFIMNTDDLINIADKRMYQMKRAYKRNK